MQTLPSRRHDPTTVLPEEKKVAPTLPFRPISTTREPFAPFASHFPTRKFGRSSAVAPSLRARPSRASVVRFGELEAAGLGSGLVLDVPVDQGLGVFD